MKMKKHYLSYLGILLVCLFVGTFFDLAIATVVFSPDNVFGTISEHVTPIVLSFALGISGACVFVGNKFEKKLGSIIKAVLSFFAMLVLVGLGTLLSYGYGGIASAIASVVVFVAAIVFVAKLPAEDKAMCQKAGVTIFFTVVVAFTAIEAIKMFWGRVRFRSMNGNYDLFTEWFQINGDKYLSSVPSKEELKSFPSGHSEWANFTFAFPLIASCITKLKKYAGKIFWGSAIYVLLMMFSRMTLGAHFLTDVTMGALITFGLFVIFNAIFMRKKSSPLQNA